jgi:hypothetical protein
MVKEIFSRVMLFLYLSLFFGLLATAGCQSQKPYLPKKKALPMQVNKVVVAGFRTALSQGDEPDVIRDPISGAVFMAEPVPNEIAQKMSRVLFEKVSTEKGFDAVSPSQAKWAFSSVVRAEQNLGASTVEILQKVGNSFGADAVLAGYIYRWREREGADFAANRPASVAFNLLLISAAEGRILWKGKFNKTQRSLSENVLDLATFRESGGRWITAEKLGMLGLRDLLAEMPTRRISAAPREHSEGEGP